MVVLVLSFRDISTGYVIFLKSSEENYIMMTIITCSRIEDVDPLCGMTFFKIPFKLKSKRMGVKLKKSFF
jgi:hypothetical protein